MIAGNLEPIQPRNVNVDPEEVIILDQKMTSSKDL